VKRNRGGNHQESLRGPPRFGPARKKRKGGDGGGGGEYAIEDKPVGCAFGLFFFSFLEGRGKKGGEKGGKGERESGLVCAPLTVMIITFQL